MESATVRVLRAALGESYTLERELGRGGMATVYLARDLRHRRSVAVKVLHPELSAVIGPERFLREIELTANLQHPHILPLFDSGRVPTSAGAAGGHLYYVMPYVEGETLRARLERERQLPVEDAVRLAREVASALAYAHARGVIHRDIKPENILLQSGANAQDAYALVADFGIALAVAQAGGERMTQTGMSLGTPQYMAPEQAMGDKSVDTRADVYALGAVLYEMLAGEPPFTGPTPQSIVAKVMTEEPKALTLVRRSVPPHVDAAVLRALEKLPADRFATAAAFADALAAASPNVAVRSRLMRRAPVSRRTLAMLVVGALVAGAAVGSTLGWARGRSATLSAIGASARGPVRFTIDPDSAAPQFGAPAISPDGRTVVYPGVGPNGARLYVRQLDDLSARALEGSEDGDQPFFSPDGEWIGFYSNGALRKLRLAGGAPVTVTPVPPPAHFAGGSWGEDDMILYAIAPRIGLFRVPANGGKPSRIVVADSTLRLLQPHLLPGARSVLLTVTPNYRSGRLGVLDLVTSRLRQFNPAVGARYATGAIVFVGLGGELYRQPFDIGRLEPTGTPEQIATGLDASDIAIPLGASFDISPAGVLVFRAGHSPSSGGALRLILRDRSGRELSAIPARMPWAPRFSPDGGRFIYGANPPGRDSSDLYITNLGSGTTQRLTTDVQDNNDPQWSPDGQTLAYSAVVPTRHEKDVVVQSVRGGTPRRFVKQPGAEWPSDWTRDGRAFLFTQLQPSGDQDIWVQPIDGSPAHPYLVTASLERGAVLSPDGRWAAYLSDETGRDEVYVQAFPAAGRKTVVSLGGGTNPVWGSDGLELYYWQGDQLISALLQDESAGGPPSVRGRMPLFRAPYHPNEHAMYDVSPDGTKFIIVEGGPRAGRLVVALGVLGTAAR